MGDRIIGVTLLGSEELSVFFCRVSIKENEVVMPPDRDVDKKEIDYTPSEGRVVNIFGS